MANDSFSLGNQSIEPNAKGAGWLMPDFMTMRDTNENPKIEVSG